MVDSDKVYIQAVRLIIASVKPLGYEVNIDETKYIIKALVNETFYSKKIYFDTYDEAKARIVEIKLHQVVNKGKKRIAKLKEIYTLF